MEAYLELKDRVLAGPSASVDLNEMHVLLQKEYQMLLQFIADRDADMVSLACDGMGTDDALLISVLCHRTREQLLLADEHFRRKSAGNKTIRERIHSEMSGNYGEFMCSIVQSVDAIHGKCSAVQRSWNLTFVCPFV